MARATLDETTSNSPLEAAIESRWFLNLITGLIILNAAILGILTYADSLPPTSVYWLEVMDRGITYAFAFEILLKLFVYRFMFFRSGWNWFDFIVVGISMVPGGQGFSVLRAMRVLRVLRLLHVVPMMRRITEALLKALPGMGAIVAVLALLTYVYAVMATNMYGDTSNEEVLELFGDLPRSAYSLFQVMTMDGWRFEVVQKVVDDGHPWAPLFFLTFIFVASFAVLNLFIALIVDALAAEQKAATEELLEDIEEDAEHAEEERDEIFDLLRSLKDEIAELKSVVSQQSQQR
ncbi:ion transporter [Henriciella mobilis]|uniref:ion transporter n=1 Tax=Henriciella mobilis TaxID=2305467 RepID=UPI000E673FE1|nr:ion transporter [Henriciella mobilis]RIJ16166.1 ion transporter [Henriciella mobilis]RIJ22923.1 ion transporter [Henriciella mobilis]